MRVASCSALLLTPDEREAHFEATEPVMMAFEHTTSPSRSWAVVGWSAIATAID